MSNPPVDLEGSETVAFPVLRSADGRVRLRAHTEADLPGIVERASDPETIRFVPVPTPPGGYGLAEARAFVDRLAAGRRAGRVIGWAIEARIGAEGRYAGSIDLGRHPDGSAHIGFSLHPSARGMGVMSTALRLVRDYALDVEQIPLLRWEARVGNWASRRVAAAAGFRFAGTLQRTLNQRGEFVEGWLATITTDDERAPIRIPEPPVLSAPRVRLRPLVDDDADRIVEACTDPDARHWLNRLPDPYDRTAALGFVESTREAAAIGKGLTWAITAADAPDLDPDLVVGAIGISYDVDPGLVEIGYWTHPAARRRGVMVAAVQTVVDYLTQHTTVRSALIRCAAGNTGSARVAERAGFNLIGARPLAAVGLTRGTFDAQLLFQRVCHTP